MRFVPWAMIVLTAAVASGAAPTTQISGTRSAACDVNVWSSYQWTPSLLDLKLALIAQLSEPARTLLNVSPDALQQYLTIDYWRNTEVAIPTPQGRVDGPVRLHLEVNLDSAAQPAAKEFLAAVVAALPSQIEAEQNGDTVQEKCREQLGDTQGQLMRLTDDIQSTRARLIDEGLGGALEGVSQAVSKLYEQRQEMRLELAAAKAEQQALAQEILQVTKQAEEKAASDPIAQQMQEIVALKEKRAGELQQQMKNGVASPDQVDAALADAAEARVQLLERRESVAETAGGDVLADLRKQLAMIEVNLAQANARDQVLSDDSQRMRDADQEAEQAEQKKGEADRLAQQMLDLESRMQDLQQNAPHYPAPIVQQIK
jgi:hypothetical protein